MFRVVNSSKRFFSKWNVPEHKIVIDPTSHRLAHPIWCLKDAESVQITHYKPNGVRDWIAFSIMKCLRVTFDYLSGYKPGQMTEAKYLKRFIFLETVAGVPGMIGGMIRHLRSLRSMQQDGGWIHHLLEEAENERVHLLTFLQLRQPGLLFRLAILGTQFVFVTGFSALYLLSSKTAHRFVGYLEEEAVKTYTNCIKELDEGQLPEWAKLAATKETIRYWGLPENAKWRDVLLAIRADEVMHREVNHHLANLHPDQSVEGHKYTFLQDRLSEAKNM